MQPEHAQTGKVCGFAAVNSGFSTAPVAIIMRGSGETWPDLFLAW